MMKFSFLMFALTATNAAADHAWDDRDLNAGRAIYAENCAACHGANLEGQQDWRKPHADGTLPAPPHDSSGHTWHHDDDLLFDYTKLGGRDALDARGITGFNSAMPAFDTVLSDAQIWDVLAYIRSTWSDRERAFQAGRTPAH